MQSGCHSDVQKSPVDHVQAGEFDRTGPQSSSNSDSSIYGSFTREYAQLRQAWSDLDESTDYCYKGRVDDEILYRPTLLPDERVILKPCSISLGTGVYYVFPSYSVTVINGVLKPAKNSRSPRTIFSGGATKGNQQIHLETIQRSYLEASYDTPLGRDSMLSRLYRDYGNPQDYTIHYMDRFNSETDQRHNLALIRPNINIHKPTLHLPGCRFPVLNALLNDFYHPEWNAKPWDDDFSKYCGAKNICNNDEPDFLNSRLVVGTDGNEYLEYDMLPFQALGNNLVPDISSLGDHQIGTKFDEHDVIHKVYMQSADQGHECLQLESVCGYDTSTENGAMTTDRPLFGSHANCGTQFKDFADGYACLSGMVDHQGEDIGRDGLFDEIFDSIGVPRRDSTASTNVLILLSSGIRSEKGIRLDCGCLLFDCDQTEESDMTAICSVGLFLNNGEYEWEGDHIQMESTMKLDQNLEIGSMLLDGSIGSLLETV
jgi:hypothetical protein